MASKSRTPLYLGLALAGAGGYYLYKSGGDPQKAKDQVKADAGKARGKLPHGEKVEQVGEELGAEAGARIDEAVQAAQTKTRNAGEDFNKYAKEGIGRIDEIRHDTARAMEASIDKIDKKVEQKASEAKKGLSSWFGGGGGGGSTGSGK